MKEEPQINKKVSNNSQSSESEKKNESLKNNKKESEKSVKSEKSEKSSEDTGLISYKDLPNYDLFEKFIKLKKVKQFIQNVVFEGYADVISGIFNDIKP